MSLHAGCAACKGKQVYFCYMIERPDGLHMVHMEAGDCPVCHPSLLEDPFLAQGWTPITEELFHELNKDPSYCDLDV